LTIRRRDFGLMAASSLLVLSAPRLARADSGDKFTIEPSDPTHHTVHAKGAEHTNPPTTAQFLTFNWKSIDFQSPEVAQDSWPKIWPQNGNAMVLIDYKGNWQFTSQFPSDSQLKDPCWVKVVFGLKGTTVPTGVAITKVYKVDKNGGSGSKNGSADPIISDLWKLIVQGHTYTFTASVHPIPPQNPPPPPQEPPKSSGGGGSSCGGALAAFFSGGLSCL